MTGTDHSAAVWKRLLDEPVRRAPAFRRAVRPTATTPPCATGGR
ncbi:hypothetical protein ACFYUY_02040 [Kitasatospora sp. NPDC004745]